VVSHWVRYATDESFVPNLDKCGFVYIITNTETTKAYVGCKQYVTGKKKIPSRWEQYTGSSKYLNADIEKEGKEKFKFEAIAEYKNKRSLRYYEAYYQMKWDVLTDTLKDSDDPAFYNSYVGGKFYRPVESYQDPEYRRKLSEARTGKYLGEEHYKYKGKAELYLDGKRMVVHCLNAWCDENGYDIGYICAIARTNKDGFYNTKYAKGGKRRAVSLKGPLGTITKVKWLVDND